MAAYRPSIQITEILPVAQGLSLVDGQRNTPPLGPLVHVLDADRGSLLHHQNGGNPKNLNREFLRIPFWKGASRTLLWTLFIRHQDNIFDI